MSRLLPFIILILLILGVVIAVPVLLQPDHQRQRIAAYLSERFQHSVTIDKADASYFPPVLRFHQVTVWKSIQSPLMQVDEVDAGLDWKALLHLKVLPRELTLLHPVLYTHRRDNGTWDWDDWSAGLKATVAGDSWALRSIRWHAGECHGIDGLTGQEISLLNMEGDIDDDRQMASLTATTQGLPAAATVTFEGKGHFLGKAQWSGEARVADEGRQWLIQIGDQAGAWDVKSQAHEWRWSEFFSLIQFYARWPRVIADTNPPLLMVDWKTHVTLDSGKATFYNSATLGGGMSEVKGDISASSGTLVARGTGAFQDVPLSYFSSEISEFSSVEGKVTGITRFEFSLSTPSWSGFTGVGSVLMKDGQYYFSEATLGSLRRSHTLKYLKKKFPHFEEKGFAFKEFTTHWTATNGMISFDDGRVDGGDVQAAFAGTLDAPRHGMDSYVRFQIHETSRELLKEIPGHYVYGPSGHEHIQPIYGHLQGSWNDWLVRSIPSRKIPAAVQSALRSTLTSH